MKESELDEMHAWIQRHMALVAGAGVILAVLIFLRLKKPAPTAEPAAATDQTPHTVYNDTYNTYQMQPGGTPTPHPTPAPIPTPGSVPITRPPQPTPGGRPTGDPHGPHTPSPGGRPTGDPHGPHTPSPPAPHQSVTVKPWPDQDSTLSGIATHYHVSGGWMPIYNLDKSTIDAQAHAHGHYGDEYDWLYAGEVLALPN